MKQPFLRRRTMPLWVTLAVWILSSAAITLVTASIQPGGFADSLRGMLSPPILLALNALPAFVLTAVVWLLCGNVFAGASVTALVLELLSYANRLKMEGRNDPLVPADVTLLRESLQAVGSYQLDLHLGLLALIAATVLGFAVLAVLFRSARLRIVWRAVGTAAAAGVFAACLLTIYPSKPFYEALEGPIKANVPQVYNTYGFTYCFLHNLNLYPIDRPEGYDAAQVEQWAKETLPKAQPIRANIVFVMGEAFTDLSDEPVFGYTAEDNPIRTFHALAESDRAISGHVTVSGFGAGTANTEFDVLTGMQTETISENTTSSFRVVHRNLDTLARVYLADGYRTWLMHPGDSWFYNRCSVYPYFGITDQMFVDAFSQEDYDGTFVTDQAFARELKNWLGENAADGSAFVYSVTIENHQSYTYNKYGYEPDLELPETLALSDEARMQLRVYFYGTQHTSDMLGDLTAYLDTLEAPTLLIFFGDHRPALGADYLAYREIGSRVGASDSPEDTIYTYETPYMIWANAAFADEVDMAEAEAALQLPPGNYVSSQYLGSLVYELTGRVGSNAYFDALTQLRRTLPVLCHGSYMLPDGTCTQTLNDQQAEAAQRLRWWEYYRLKNGMQE